MLYLANGHRGLDTAVSFVLGGEHSFPRHQPITVLLTRIDVIASLGFPGKRRNSKIASN